MFNRRAINLKKKLADGGISPGIWVSLPSPTACEVIADAGLDWIVVDAEHSPFNPETLQHMLMAFSGKTTVPLIRVPWNDAVIIKQMLDMGWDGVLVPQVNTVEQTKQAVAACRYPPAGKRGFGPRRAANYDRDLDEYVQFANQSVICIIQIEDVAGAEQIDEIVHVLGLDWIFVGPCDMSGTTKRFLDMDNQEIWKAIRKILDTARKAGIPAGNAFWGVEAIQKTLEWGCPLVVLGEDTSFLKDGVDKVMKAFQKVIGGERPT